MKTKNSCATMSVREIEHILYSNVIYPLVQKRDALVACVGDEEVPEGYNSWQDVEDTIERLNEIIHDFNKADSILCDYYML